MLGDRFHLNIPETLVGMSDHGILVGGLDLHRLQHHALFGHSYAFHLITFPVRLLIVPASRYQYHWKYEFQCSHEKGIKEQFHVRSRWWRSEEHTSEL